MDVNAIMQAVGSLGFPIVAYGLIFWLFKEELRDVKEALAQNTIVMTELRDALRTITGRSHSNGSDQHQSVQ